MQTHTLSKEDGVALEWHARTCPTVISTPLAAFREVPFQSVITPSVVVVVVVVLVVVVFAMVAWLAYLQW